MAKDLMNKNTIPDIIISRLPIYLRSLRHAQAQGKINISSQELGARVGISAAQIRKDLSQFGEFGKQGTGYDIAFLVEQLRSILKVKHVWDVAVVGMGDMGHALARYGGFTDRGFKVTMVFDIDPKKVGPFVVRDIDELVPAIQQSGIKIAMLCVPAPAAIEVTKLLLEAGIKAILNYAPISLNVPPGIRVQYIDPSIGLQRMTYYLDESTE
jgi:redox-sensing transcriptional repressor